MRVYVARTHQEALSACRRDKFRPERRDILLASTSSTGDNVRGYTLSSDDEFVYVQGWEEGTNVQEVIDYLRLAARGVDIGVRYL